jgi:hypothetical protein
MKPSKTYHYRIVVANASGQCGRRQHNRDQDFAHERFVVGWSCKGHGFCPNCGGRRMNACALNLLDHVLPDVPLRQFVVTVPFPLRFRLAFDGKLLSQVLRILIDTVAATAGSPPAGPANKRQPIRIVLDPDAHPVAKGNLCGQHPGSIFTARPRSPPTTSKAD